MARPSRAGGKTRATKTRKAGPAEGRKANKTKHRSLPTAARTKRPTVSDLSKELKEAREQQAATGEVLKVIASSPADVKPALQAIVESACTFCNAYDCGLLLKIGNDLHFSVHHGPIRTGDTPRPISRDWVVGRSVVDKMPVQVSDFQAPEAAEFPEGQRQSREQGHRCTLSVPLLREGEAIGAIALRRLEPVAFSDKQIALLQTFADQAVIAIGNVRLFEEVQVRTRELTESLQQQTATSEVLQVISSSPGELEPVFETMLENATRICGANFGTMYRYDGAFHLMASHNAPSALVEARMRTPVHLPPPNTGLGRLERTRKVVHIHDIAAEPGYAADHAYVAGSKLSGARTILLVPMLKGADLVGSINIFRQEVHPFTDKQVELLGNFAKQAVIAIENARLLKELHQRTDDLSEALTYQTGSANILKVIASSPTQVKPVLDAIVESACELCGAYDAVLRLTKGDKLELGAHHGNVPADWNLSQINLYWTAGRAALEGKPVHVHDMSSSEGDEFPEAQARAREQGHRTILSVPLLKDDESIGTITLRRLEVNPFTEKQIALLQTFADQAVIAIGNVRLFEEVQAKSRDLSEALTYQTGSANILRVIASSPTDINPVLQAIAESACELCNAYDAIVRLREGDYLVPSAHYGSIPINTDRWPIERNSVSGRALIDKKPVHVHDMQFTGADEFPESQQRARELGHRTILSVPLLREGESIGVIALRRMEVNPFSEKQIALLQTFADQAVIAIGNVRLFEEVQTKTHDLEESLHQQTATADVLRVISASPGELSPVFETMLENAVRLCEAKFAMMRLLEGDQFRGVATWNLPPAFSEFLAETPIHVDPKLPLGQVARTKQPVHVHDILQHEAYIERYPGMIALAEIGGGRTLLQVPMLKEDHLVGTIGLYRQEVRPFTDKQIALVQSFAAQAVIAIENARLLNELRQRTNDLSKSLDDLRTAQDRLVQTEKLASLGQLTAGIAHEIKNPLNFVNNFSALSVELTDELSDALKQERLTDKGREETDALTGLLKDNLGKVLQHGKRADSIVKNMLLHSREGSGERRSAEINSLVEESLNLAYHGARAEKAGFSITLRHDLDPEAGALELYPQEMTRALLNLISNGFYAATQRKAEAADGAFEPILSAATRNLGEFIEIRIRDNGTGIPPEVREKMFNPFFTTKPTGEGTGLGLSMTHDIIVKQHGGRIDVETEPGRFTEFIITLPRKGPSTA